MSRGGEGSGVEGQEKVSKEGQRKNRLIEMGEKMSKK